MKLPYYHFQVHYTIRQICIHFFLDCLGIQYLDAYNIYVDGVKMGSRRPGETYTTPSVDSKEDEIITVTLVYQDGVTENEEIEVTVQYLASGYTFDGNHYDANSDIIVNSDLYLVSDYVEVYTPADLPTPTMDSIIRRWNCNLPRRRYLLN